MTRGGDGFESTGAAFLPLGQSQPADYTAQAVSPVEGHGPEPTEDDNPAPEEKKKSQATRLVDLATDRYDLGVSQEGEAFATPKEGPALVILLKGSKPSLKGELSRLYFDEYGSAATSQAFADALTVLEGRAQQLDPTPLHLRVAKHLGLLLIDLGDAKGRTVVVGPGGWDIIDDSPVRFRRTALTGTLPEPTRNGTLEHLWTLLNVAKEYRPILAAILVAALMPDIPHPVVTITGEQGTGKSSATRIIANAIDPSPVQPRKPPRDVEQWTVAAAGSWVVALDNLSAISPQLSDALCRACTGDGDVKRKLYSDGELHVVAFRRSVILNGIDLGAIADDLADRLVTVGLERISDDARLLDADLTDRWGQAHPDVLGALLDLTADVLAVLPSVKLGGLPRMADFARVLAAVDQVLDTDGFTTFCGLRRDLAEETVTTNPVLVAITATVTRSVRMTAADLLTHITPNYQGWHPPKGWPNNARELTTQLNRHVPSLRRLGWTAQKTGDLDSRSRSALWELVPPMAGTPV